jgi:predicted amidophosphoribosyltransferase
LIKFLNNLLDYIFLKYCENCNKKLSFKEKYFCNFCLEDFYITNEKFFNFSYLFDDVKAVNTFIKLVKNSSYLNFSKIISSYIVVKLYKINFFDFEYIAIDNYSFFKKDYTYYIAKHLAKSLNKKFIKKINNEKILLIIDKLTKKKIEKYKYKKNVFFLSLTFDTFFDDFNLSG